MKPPKVKPGEHFKSKTGPFVVEAVEKDDLGTTWVTAIKGNKKLVVALEDFWLDGMAKITKMEYNRLKRRPK